MPTTVEMEITRMLKARSMLEHGCAPEEIEDGIYIVDSLNRNNIRYKVLFYNGEWSCDCPDYRYHHIKCKHIWTVILTLEQKAREYRFIEPVETKECTRCHSENIKKYGMRHNKYGNLQRYLCADCGKTFSINIGFEKMKHNPKAITTAMQLYFSGESLRNTQKSLRLIGADVSHQTISNWIEKYIGMMKAYVDNLKPNVGNTWRADEVWIKVKGDMKYLFALMDDESIYWIAQEVADSKYKHDARMLFAEGKKIIGHNPEILITDVCQHTTMPLTRNSILKANNQSISTLSNVPSVDWRLQHSSVPAWFTCKFHLLSDSQQVLCSAFDDRLEWCITSCHQPPCSNGAQER
jgi:transposase-like protein